MSRSRALSLSSIISGSGGGHDMITIESNHIGVRNAQHLTIAGGFLDFALFVADVEHLKYLLDVGSDHVKYYILLIILLCASLILQLVVVFLMFIVGFKNNKPRATYQRSFKKSNNDKTGEELSSNQNGQQPSSSSTSISVPFNENQMVSINDKEKVDTINHLTICLVTIIAILNVFITVFGDRSSINFEHMKHLSNHTDNISI
ncbi:hypothetical protein DERF_002555 [Dermatophagoides farinae]|uniref:Uncharacterized protein n=1 Tax=Dermatophagoides farinae TaxID=6954 RepID=A0A922IGH5_DERFA|nr:uncharacterized protein LOC124498256 [Dermatophagoides farinae]XP_046917948.1 uncharacterized protein LOC124498256 [Dermatophagoides farinae]KAH7636546.1 hypothetical protein HUG17_10516 [Dermatophagoides farinae]KAH9528633.1 hypothetical protein DERF_002555 [Dermatophagoides farinae]